MESRTRPFRSRSQCGSFRCKGIFSEHADAFRDVRDLAQWKPEKIFSEEFLPGKTIFCRVFWKRFIFFLLFWGSGLFGSVQIGSLHLGFSLASVSAQTLYPSVPLVGVQSATLENIMLLQNLRDTDRPCIGRNSWTIGYGTGGVMRGNVQTPAGADPNRFETSFGGILTGTDLNFGTTSRLGAFFAYDSVTLKNASDSEKANADQYLWGLYGRKDWSGGYFMGTGAIGHGRLRQKTFSENSTLEALGETNAWRAYAYGELGTEFRFSSVIFQPFWGLQYYHASSGSETADPADPALLSLPALETNSFQNVVGVRFAGTFWKNDVHSLCAHCSAFWFHEFLTMDDLGGTDSISAQDVGRDWFIIAPTLEWTIGNFRIWSGYIAMVNDRETLHLGQGGFAFCW
ncbi:MAG: autotransporter outer membrane beta-barrel domain-containing protein [Thermoguttaceae bacterium]|nr:autotransporter outer membrane beta-barrel domain-containing protein [Thermoguttaceae bacterium]